MFAVTCKDCGQTLVTAPLLRDPEIAVLVEHLRRCSSDPLRADALLGEVLSRVRVASITR
jgi:hypothetical protein